jgi:hypothetical protein
MPDGWHWPDDRRWQSWGRRLRGRTSRNSPRTGRASLACAVSVDQGNPPPKPQRPPSGRNRVSAVTRFNSQFRSPILFRIRWQSV